MNGKTYFRTFRGGEPKEDPEEGFLAQLTCF